MSARASLAAAIFTTLGALAALSAPVRADGWRHPGLFRPEATFKLGVYDPSEGVGSGVFGGVELSARASRHFSIGLTGDYFYRGTETRSDAFIETENPYDIPVESSLSEFVSSSHLAMLGVTGRLRMPLGPDGPAPFVQGGLLAQLLHLRASGAGIDGDGGLGRHHDGDVVSDTFTGIGWHVGGGIEQPLDARVGLVGEAGYLFAEPTKQESDWQETITYRALASGYYARAGVSVRY